MVDTVKSLGHQILIMFSAVIRTMTEMTLTNRMASSREVLRITALIHKFARVTTAILTRLAIIAIKIKSVTILIQIKVIATQTKSVTIVTTVSRKRFMTKNLKVLRKWKSPRKRGAKTTKSLRRTR